MEEATIINHIEESIKKGERAKLLWELFIETINSDQKDGIKEVLQKFKKNQEEYYEAVNKIKIETEFMLNNKKTHKKK